MNFLTRDDIKRRGVTFCNKHLLELERRGNFPKRVRFGPRRVAWVASEIDTYLASLVEARISKEVQSATP
jgi:hypothetical protein